MVKGLFLSAYDMVNTAWANNTYISILFLLFSINSHKFLLIPMESFTLNIPGILQTYRWGRIQNIM